MKNNVYDCLIERNKKILKVLYPIYFAIILVVICSIYFKNLIAVCVAGLIFIIYSIFFFKFLFKMMRLNNSQIQEFQERGKDKYKD